MSEKQVATTIRIPESLKKNLEGIAADESRSLNNMICVILQRYVKGYLMEEKKEINAD